MSTVAGSSNTPLPRQQDEPDHGFMPFLKDLWSKMGQNDYAGLAAEMAYNWMMALIPILIFLFMLFGMFGTHTDVFAQVMGNLQRLMPGDAFNLLQGTITELTKDSSGGGAFLALLGALWTSSNGAMTLEKALNRAYRCTDDNRNFIMQRVIALLIVLGLAVILFVCTNLIMFGGSIIDAVEHYFNPGGLIIRALEVARWVLPLVSLVLVSMFIYSIAPNYRKPGYWHKTWPGALTFVMLWVIISTVFSLYVSNMANYNKVYGPMGAIIVLMFWLYLTSYALLIGGQVNAMLSDCDEGTLNAPPTPEAPPSTGKKKGKTS